jgi:hypothetical protein
MCKVVSVENKIKLPWKPTNWVASALLLEACSKSHVKHRIWNGLSCMCSSLALWV